MSRADAIALAYLVTIIAFVLALRFLSSPTTAPLGNRIGALGMLIALAATFAQAHLHNYLSILIVMAVFAPIGAYAARAVKMTAMPQMVALFNGVGGGAAALVALADFHNVAPAPGRVHADVGISIVLSALIGSISFAGSLVAFGKLQELVSGRPFVFPGQHVVDALVLLGAAGFGAAIVAGADAEWLLFAEIALALLFGVMFVLPIGGADMPVVISLLNAFTGIAASATGFVLHNTVLIVSGMLVGASGTLLTLMMARSMGRSVANVFFGAFGQLATGGETPVADTDGQVQSA